MTWPDHSYDGLDKPNTDPFADFEMDDEGGSTLDDYNQDDTNDCVEDSFDDIDWL